VQIKINSIIPFYIDLNSDYGLEASITQCIEIKYTVYDDHGLTFDGKLTIKDENINNLKISIIGLQERIKQQIRSL
jgi:hypothetical protein